MNRNFVRLLPIFLFVLVALQMLPRKGRVAGVHAADGKPRIWLAGAVRQETQFKGGSLDKAAPLSLAADDFDSDGIGDVAAGYSTPTGGRIAFFRGNLDAFAPQSQASFWAISRNEFPSPYLPDAKVVAVPDAPDFIASGDFIGHDGPGVVAAARGGSKLHVLARGSDGSMQLMQSVDVPGVITALASHRLSAGKYVQVVVGVRNSEGPALLIYSGSNEGLLAASRFALNGEAASFVFGNLDGDGIDDVLAVAGGELWVLHGASQTVDQIRLPYKVSAVTLGRFVFDRSPLLQIAMLAMDGSVHIVAQDGLDRRPFTPAEVREKRAAAHNITAAYVEPVPERTVVWQEIESYSQAGTPGASGRAPLMFNTRISNNAADDVMLMSASRMTIVGHSDINPGSGVLADRVDLAADAVAAIPVRVNVDWRPGVVFFRRGDALPHVMMPLPDPTFTVNTTSDGVHAGACAAATPGQCTLREALLEANGDTVMVPAGTYTLTIGKVANDCTGRFGALSAEHSVTIVGAGQNSTIIQAGTVAYNAGTPNGVDMVMNVNEDLAATNCPVTSATASLSSLTLQNGHNLGSSGFDGDGGCMEFDTGSAGTATLTLTNVTLQNCNTLQGGGGGVVIFNSVHPAGGGGATITNSIIQGNSVVNTGSAGNGGGVAVAQDAHVTITNSQIKNNNAVQVCTPTCGVGDGGGLIFFEPQNVSAITAQSFIHSVTISGNQSAGPGGGIWSGTNLVIDTDSVISGNTAGTNGSSPVAGQTGGGLNANVAPATCPLASTCTTTLSKVTITGNSASGDGGGISNGNLTSGAGALTISFSRLAGNTTGGSGSNLNNIKSTVTATDNWWGTNTPSGTINTNSGTTTFDPFIVLANAASPNLIRIGDTSTVTADMSKDNHGNGGSLSGNLDVLVGLPSPGPIFPATATHGSLSAAQANIQSNGQATETYTATSGGMETIPVTIDQQSVNATITVLFPPSIAKAFDATHIPVFTFSPTVSTLTFTITNPNTTHTLSGLAFTDNLPSGLEVANTPNVVNHCSGTVTATANSTTINLSGGSIGINTTCTVTVDVKGVSDGVQNNTSGNVTATDAGGLTGNTANASITVINPPSMSKGFAPSTIVFGQTSTLTLTLSNSNANSSLNGIAFTDTLPSGVGLSAPNNLNSTCSGTPSAGSGAVSLTGASLSPGASCTVTVTVSGTAVGTPNNSVNATSTDAGGLIGPTATANLTINKADTTMAVASSVNPSVFGQSVTFTATVTASAPGAGTPTGTVQFVVDGSNFGSPVSLSSGMATSGATATLSVSGSPHSVVAKYNGDGNFNTSNNLSSALNQTVNAASTSTAVASSVNPSAFGQSVTFTATVTDTAANSAAQPTGSVQFVVDSVNFGSPVTLVGATSTSSTGGVSTATLSVSGSPHTVTANYVNADGNFSSGSGSLVSGQTVNKDNTSLGVTSSQNASKVGQLVTFTATVTANTPGSGTPTGTVSFTDNSNPLTCNQAGTLSGGVAQCSTSALAAGNHTIAASYGGDGSFNGTTGSLNTNPQVVVAPPQISKAFTPTSIVLNNTTQLTITLTNPGANTAAEAGVSFSDTLPTGLTPGSPTSNTCNGTASTSGQTVSLSGGSIAVSGSCQIVVTVTGSAPGSYTNTTGSVSSTNGGTGSFATASMTVTAADLTMSMTHAGNFSQGQVGDTFTLVVSNIAANASDGSLVTVSDVMPSGLTVTAASGTGWNCTPAVSCTRSDVLGSGGSYPPITIVVSVNSSAPASITNTATVSGGGDSNPSNNSASNTIPIGQTSQSTLTGLITAKSGATNARVWTITVTNHDTSPANNTQITGLTLLQTLGTACTPVINTVFPVNIGTIAPSGTASGNVTIDFSSCATGARFRATIAMTANGGANGGTSVISNQVP